MKKFGPLILAALLIFFVFFLANESRLRNQPRESPATQKEKVNTTSLSLPPTFSIDIFAKGLKAPRVLKFDGSGNLLASIPTEGKVVALPDQNKDGRADQTITMAVGLDRPHGIATRGDKIYIAQTRSITVYDYDAQNFKLTNPKTLTDLPAGGRHFTRTIEFGPDGLLYVSIGSTCDVCEEKDSRAGTIMTVDPTSGKSEIVATGLRNSVFFVTSPQSGKIWATEMGRDFLGDDLPPDEINIVEKGKNYGWPYCYGNQVHDTNFDKKVYIQTVPQLPCGPTEPPVYEICAHCAPLGLTFIKTKLFPADWQGDLLVAYHGSWNRSTPVGYKVARLIIEGEKVLREEDFISGFIEGSQVVGRPVDLIFSPDALYLSDDHAGVIYRIWR